MSTETAEPTVDGQEYNLKDIFNFQDVPDDVILRAMIIGMIVSSSISTAERRCRSFWDFSDEIEKNIMSKIGQTPPGFDHSLTKEEAEAIFAFFANPTAQLLFFNYF